MVLVAGLLCLLLASMIAGNIVRLVVRNNQIARTNHARLQAEWLAEAGVQRGLAAMRNDREYDGETWDVPGSDLGGDAVGRVVVEVIRDPNGDGVSATAVYPVGVDFRATYERWAPLAPNELADDTSNNDTSNNDESGRD